MRFGLCVAVLLTGCVEASSEICDGRACPEGTTCAELTGTTIDPHRCVTKDAVSVCSGKTLLEPCTYDGLTAPGACYQTLDGAVCLESGCGNFLVDQGEVCDDGNSNAGDKCSNECRSDETCGNGILDPLALTDTNEIVLNEVCDDANLTGYDGCTSLCDGEIPVWGHVDSTRPPSRQGGEMAYDPIRRRLVLFGGTEPTVFTSCFSLGKPYVNDVWESSDGISWVQVFPHRAPLARKGYMFAFDGNTQRVLLFGGDAGSLVNDTWLWDGAIWTQLDPATSPPPRDEGAMAYDSRRKKVVLFGGRTGPLFANDTWEWDGTTWTQIQTPTSPGYRWHHGMTYDPVRGVIVMAGGYVLGSADGQAGLVPSDTWEYDGTNWRLVTVAGTPFADNLGFDTVNNQVIAYAPPTPNTVSSTSTYTLNGTTWTNQSISTPGPLQYASMTTDPRGTVVLFGGYTVSGCTGGTRDETWLWNGSQWSSSVPPTPPQRSQMAGAVDLARRRIVIAGGMDPAGNLINQTWEYDGARWTLFDQQPWLSGRFGAAMAYDAAHKKIVLFGGTDTQDPAQPSYSDTYVRSGAIWSQPSPAHSPPGRSLHKMVYDGARGRVVLFGGSDIDGNPVRNDTWEWDGTDWTQRMPAHSPPGRVAFAMGYDPIRQRVVVFGGVGTTQFDDTWEWDGTDWTQVPTATRPLPRRFPEMAWDPARRRLILVAGAAGTVSLHDAWEWNGTNWQEIISASDPTPRFSHLTLPSLDGAGTYTFGGRSASPANAPLEIWRLRWESGTTYEYCALHSDADNDGRTGCEDLDCWATCTPLCQPGVAGCDPAAPRCGDQTCNAGSEDCRTCPEDCTTCPQARCGDTFCDPGESSVTCRGDCP